MIFVSIAGILDFELPAAAGAPACATSWKPSPKITGGFLAGSGYAREHGETGYCRCIPKEGCRFTCFTQVTLMPAAD